MALPSSSHDKDSTFEKFVTEVKQIEKRDSVLTSSQQIERLLRPGSSYFNLNPYEVLQLDSDATLEEIKKQYRKMSILLHPDKNPDDRDRAQNAFEILNRAHKQLENEEMRVKALAIINEAKEQLAFTMEEKRKKLKKEKSASTTIDEDDPEKYKRALYAITCKLFADKERRRRQLEQRDQEERKRKREEEIEQEEKKKVEAEWQKNYEESREGRVNSWQSFTKGGKKGFRPPKPKQEKR